jgi:amino acid transporter
VTHPRTGRIEDSAGFAVPGSGGTGPASRAGDEVSGARALRPRRGRAGSAVGGGRHELGVLGGLAALSLDALSSVAYGPEAILLVLAAAGTAGTRATFGVTAVIAVLLAVLTISYRQVIAVHPDGGGAYAVARTHLGDRSARLAAASLVVDYVLNVAVSITAGIAALVSAFPALSAHRLGLCLVVLALLSAVNLLGVAESARLLIVPTLLFVVGVGAVAVLGLLRATPEAVATGRPLVHADTQLGLLLLLRAFASGCSALTGVEAIANAVPQFRPPRPVRAARTEVLLGLLLGGLLLGLGGVIGRFNLVPRDGVTVLDQATAAALGHGAPYYLMSLLTTAVLALAANTSFGGLPVLLSLLGRDDLLPHWFGLRGERPVYRYGVVVLAAAAAAMIVIVDADTQTLIPMFAIGVFIGFTLSQAGLVRYWAAVREPGWARRAAINGLGAVLTGIALLVLLIGKFTEGAWLVVIAIPALMVLFTRVRRYYAAVGESLGLGHTPPWPDPNPGLVIVPVSGIDRMTTQALSAALSMGCARTAVTVRDSDASAEAVRAQWAAWAPGVELVVLLSPNNTLVDPIVDYVSEQARSTGLQVIVLIPEVEPRRARYRVLQNQRGFLLPGALRLRTDVVVATLPFRPPSNRRPDRADPPRRPPL